jgi:WD40 repeat protein
MYYELSFYCVCMLYCYVITLELQLCGSEGCQYVFFAVIEIYCDRVIRQSYSTSGANRQLMSFSHHKKSCRRLQFNGDGSRLVTASKDKSISLIDMTNGVVTQTIKKAHE